jgi:drug/metabolite transporter (DMT)-like permease
MAPVVICNVAANLLLKTGAGKAPSALLAGLLSWQSFLGLCAFGMAGLLYAFALRHLPLSLAQLLTVSQYPLVVFAAMLFLGESLDRSQIIGSVLIAIGVMCIIK